MTRKNAWDNSRESVNLSFAVVVEQMSWWYMVGMLAVFNAGLKA